MAKEICFPTTTVLWYNVVIIMIIIGVVVGALYTIYLYKKDFIDSKLSQIQLPKIDVKIPNIFGDKPNYPERNYIGRYNEDRASQQVGFLTDTATNKRFPLYENRIQNNFYYHVVDDTENHVKIPFTIPRKEQIYNGDNVSVPEISNTELKAFIYDYPSNRF